MGKPTNYEEYKKSNNIRTEKSKYPSMEGGFSECKFHEIDYYGFSCPVCNSDKIQEYQDNLNDVLYFHGLVFEPSIRTQNAIKQKRKLCQKNKI